MNNELIQELTDAGYPIVKVLGNISAPTLSELIKECGDIFYSLTYAVYENDGTETSPEKSWIAGLVDSFHQIGRTPEEAVARLWLALNK
jgi:hypothetical protein